MGIVILVLGGLLLWVYYFPYDNSIALDIIAESYTHPMPVWKELAHYLELEVVLDVYRQWGTYIAGILSANELSMWIYVAGQITGWSVVMAFATRIRSRWSLIFFLAFLLFILLSDISAIFLYPGSFPVIEVTLSIVLLGITYLVQINWLKLTSLAIFGLCWSVLAAVWTYLYINYGWTAWLHTANSQYYLILLVTVALVWFASKDLVNILIVAANNHRRVHTRWSLRWMRVALLIIFFYLLYLAVVYHLALEVSPVIRPLHYFLLATFFLVFTSQNLLRPVQFVFTSHSNFSFLILGWIIIVLSFLFLHFSSGDLTFIRAFEKLVSVFTLIVTALYIFYLEFGFTRMIRERINVFYLLGRGVRIPFPAIMLAGLLAVLVYETTENWKSFRIFTQSYFLMEGDKAYLQGNYSLARNTYDMAIAWIPASPKGNYNLGVILMKDQDQFSQALIAFDKVSNFYDNPFATLNKGFILQQLGLNQEAKEILLRNPANHPVAESYIAHNLSNLYLSESEPDSSLVYLKKSLLANPENSLGYTHMAGIYDIFGREKLVKELTKASLETEHPSNVSLVNALSYDIEGVVESANQLGPQLQEKFTDLALSQNYLYYLMHENHRSQAMEHALFMADSLNLPQGNMLAGYLLMLSGSLEQGISRLDYVNLAYPIFSATGNMLLALAYWKAGAWNMAREYFERSGDLGNPEGYLNMARMDIILGRQDTAAKVLYQLRGEYDTLKDEVAKELAMLLQAYGQPIYAQTEWNINELDFNERMRISLYADSAEHYLWALENFRNMLAKDSSLVAPYLEMGRLYLRDQDTLALSTFKLGLTVDPQNPHLKLGVADAFLEHNEADSAKFYLQSIRDTLAANPSYLSTYARLLLQQGDTAQAINKLEVAHMAHPLKIEQILELLSLYIATEETVTARNLVVEALQYNDQNPNLWLYYARIMHFWERDKDRDQALDRYRKLSPSALPIQVLIDQWENQVASSGF